LMMGGSAGLGSGSISEVKGGRLAYRIEQLLTDVNVLWLA
jgi:hypothetical protein